MEIKNEFYTCKFINEGAQLVSLIFEGNEFIHDGLKGWAQHNPSLFPFVGKLKDGFMEIDGKHFEMGQHGLLRRAPFKVVNNDDTTISFVYESSGEDLDKFPYHFKCVKTYELQGKRLIVSHRIYNSDEKVLPFTLGHHPAFKCPVLPNEKFSDYKVVFEREEDLTQRLIDLNAGIFADASYDNVGLTGKEISLPFDNAKYNTLVYENIKSNYVCLKGPKYDVKVSNVGYPFFAIWHVDEQNFVCLEPWLGHSDVVSSDHDFFKKTGLLLLEPQKSFLNTYIIEIE